MYMMNASSVLHPNMDLRDCPDKAGKELRYNNKFHPEGHIVITRYINNKAMYMAGPEAVKLAVMFMIDDVLDFLYKQHGNGD